MVLVCDNSSSLSEQHKWGTACYSLQSLIALPDNQDRLFAGVMDDPLHPQEIPLDHLKRQKAIDEKRSRNPARQGVPFDVVKTALDQVSRVLRG